LPFIDGFADQIRVTESNDVNVIIIKAARVVGAVERGLDCFDERLVVRVVTV
jgi:hypothetical protein